MTSRVLPSTATVVEENTTFGTARQRRAYSITAGVAPGCAALAAACGVALLIEPEPGLLIEKFGQYLEFAERVNHPSLGLNFDIGHAYCVGEDPAEWVPRMKAHTRHYHFEDIAATRVHHHLVPGEGAIDFDGVFKAIAAHTPDIWITVELYPYRDRPDEAARAAKAHLRSCAARAGVALE